MQTMAASRQQLRQEVDLYQARSYAVTTSRTYAAQQRAYLSFCHQYAYTPLPATGDQLCMYVAFLARRLQYSSIKQYLNVVRVLHMQVGLPNPLGDFNLHRTLRGIRRSLGDSPTRKAPISPPMLRHLLHKLHINTPLHAGIYAAALTMFFGLLRRANVIPPPEMPFDPRLHLRRRDITFHHEGATVVIRWSKTNQYRARTFTLPLPRVRASTLCPAQALYHFVSLTPQADPNGPAFVVPDNQGHLRPITPHQFVSTVKTCLADVCDPRHIGGHSFRRGGATWLRNCGVDIELIKELGDWASEAYTRYVSTSTSSIAQTLSYAALQLPNT